MSHSSSSPTHPGSSFFSPPTPPLLPWLIPGSPRSRNFFFNDCGEESPNHSARATTHSRTAIGSKPRQAREPIAHGLATEPLGPKPVSPSVPKCPLESRGHSVAHASCKSSRARFCREGSIRTSACLDACAWRLVGADGGIHLLRVACTFLCLSRCYPFWLKRSNRSEFSSRTAAHGSASKPHPRKISPFPHVPCPPLRCFLFIYVPLPRYPNVSQRCVGTVDGAARRANPPTPGSGV